MTKFKHRLPLPLEIDCSGLSRKLITDLADFNPIPKEAGGDFHLVNGNVAKLEDAGAAYQKKAGDMSE